MSNSVFSISVPQSNPLSVSFFGLGSVQAWGYINSDGQFSLNGSIGYDYEVLGTGHLRVDQCIAQQQWLHGFVLGDRKVRRTRCRIGGRAR